MKAIAIETNIGSCGIAVSAEINADEILKFAKSFGEFLIWHNAASKTHAGGKKAEYSAQSPYSQGYADKAKASVVSVLEKHGFVNVVCETSEKVKLDDKAKFIRDMIKLGMSAEAAEAGWETAQSKMQAKKPEEQKAEEIVS